MLNVIGLDFREAIFSTLKCIEKVEVHFLWTNFEAKHTLICGQREYACHYDQPKKKYQNLKYVINITYSVGTLH